MNCLLRNLFVSITAFVIGLVATFPFGSLKEGTLEPLQLKVETAQVLRDAFVPSEPLSTELKYLCEDAVMKPLWNKITHNKNFLDYTETWNSAYSGETVDCATNFFSEAADFNGDGINEIVVRGQWAKPFCGMYSGCWFGIFEKRSEGFELTFVNGNAASFELAGEKSKGYRILTISSSSGGYGGYSQLYKFDGKKYEVSKCFQSSFTYYDKSGKPRESKNLITFREKCTIEDRNLAILDW